MSTPYNPGYGAGTTYVSTPSSSNPYPTGSGSSSAGYQSGYGSSYAPGYISGGSPSGDSYTYTANPNPYDFAIPQDPRRTVYEQDPQNVFTNWLYSQGMPFGVSQRLQGLLYNKMYADYSKQASFNTGNSNWFEDYLSGAQSGNDFNQLKSNYTQEDLGFDPRRFNARVRWIS